VLKWQVLVYKRLHILQEDTVLDQDLLNFQQQNFLMELLGQNENEKAWKYENVFLISNSDVYRINTHHDVKEMVDWLRKIGEKTPWFYWYGGI
jgi:hypothetical protein